MRSTRGGGGDGARDVGLLIAAALAFSTAGLFTRTVPVPLASMVMWRNGFGCLGLAAVLLSRRRRSGSGWPGRRALATMACSAGATICYLAAFARTSVADVAIIYATGPLLAAALGWSILGERPARRTLLATAMALVGVVVTVAGPGGGRSLVCDGLALLMTLGLAMVAVLARGSPASALPTAFGSALLAVVMVAPIAIGEGRAVVLPARDMASLAAFGLVTMTFALPAYLAGVARVEAGRAMLISALELPFAPLWVWLAFGENAVRANRAGRRRGARRRHARPRAAA